MAPLLDIRALHVGYGAIKVLHDVSLSIGQGEIVALIGANGAGKSTLLMSIFNDPELVSGEIRFKGQSIGHLPTHQIARLGISQAPEGRRIFSARSVEENLMMGILNQRSNIQDDLAIAFSRFPRLLERRHQCAGTLSGGEQQMLAIARALISRPQLLLLDEPSLGLAPIMTRQIFDILAGIADSGTTIFLVEQNAHQALKLAHRAYVLSSGRITLSGSGSELLKDKKVRSAYLG
jgi:branched-chain amino acid transport system ATP-binding protein